MALTACRNCGGTVSTLAPKCPHCGEGSPGEAATAPLPGPTPAAPAVSPTPAPPKGPSPAPSSQRPGPNAGTPPDPSAEGTGGLDEALAELKNLLDSQHARTMGMIDGLQAKVADLTAQVEAREAAKAEAALAAKSPPPQIEATGPSTSTCPACQAPLRPGLSFCTSCGQTI
jgi:hypothetical protein